MKTTNLRTYVIAILALAALFPVGRVRAGQPEHKNWISIRSDNHRVVSGTVAGEPAEMRVHVAAHVFDEGKAIGTVQVRAVEGESFLYRVVGGQATVEGGIIGDVFLVLQRVGEGGEPTGETDFATVRPSSTSEPCRIYDIAGTQVHVELETTVRILGLRHEHTRPE